MGSSKKMKNRDFELYITIFLIIKLIAAIIFIFYIQTRSETVEVEEGQRVISYTLINGHPNLEKLKLGIHLNLVAIRKIYNNLPGPNPWRMRVYSDIDIDENIQELQKSYPELDWIDMRNIPKIYEMNKHAWRFLPMGDPSVSVFLSRDLDSKISKREFYAVEEWLTTDFLYHSMRDSPTHTEYIFAGLWGAKNDLIEEGEAKLIRRNFILAKELGTEKMLEKFIWEPFYPRVLVHDSFHCQDLPGPNTRPWPIQRENTLEFVGSKDLTTNLSDQIKNNIAECPIACRPSYGKDWKYC